MSCSGVSFLIPKTGRRSRGGGRRGGGEEDQSLAGRNVDSCVRMGGESEAESWCRVSRRSWIVTKSITAEEDCARFYLQILYG